MGRSLSDDADPAAVIYDLLTGGLGKLSLPPGKIDRASFEAASVVLFGEGHGYSRAIETADEGGALIADVLKQIDGGLFEDPATGLLTLRLVRNDFILPELLDINPNNMRTPEPGWLSIQGWAETLNQVRVTFSDGNNNYVDAIPPAQNGANAMLHGKLRSLDVRYPGCRQANTARRLAARELAVVSRPTVKATVVVDRTFYQTRPLDVVTLTRPDLKINRMVMRVASVNLGQLHANAITLNLIRDVFDVSAGAFPPP